MNHIHDIFRDRAFAGIFSDFLLHRFGYHGKLAGNLFAAAEVEGLIPIIHGPAGCGYHYRLARDGHQPVYRVECTDLTESDVIYGGEEKLRRTILDTDARYTPDIILVLPTTITDVIGSDIQGIVEELAPEVKAKLIAVTSEVFSHRDRDALGRLIQDNVAACHKLQAEPSYDLLGCGFMEVMCALVAHAMEPQKKILNSVNIENFDWSYGARSHLLEIETLLRKMGVTLNVYLPGCHAKSLIHHATRAQLNIVRRGRRWAKMMEAEFGTRYLFLQNLFMYHGLTGTYRFFQEVLDRLQPPSTAHPILQREKSAAEEKIAPYREYFHRFDFGLVTQNLLHTPYLVSVFECEYKMPLKYVCVGMQEERLRTMGVSPEIETVMRENVRQALRQTGSRAELVFKATDEDVREIGRKVDYLVGTPKVTHYGEGIKIIEYPGRFTRIGFDSFVQTAKHLKMKMQTDRESVKPILARMRYDDAWYPMLDEPFSRVSHDMWRSMWAFRGKP